MIAPLIKAPFNAISTPGYHAAVNLLRHIYQPALDLTAVSKIYYSITKKNIFSAFAPCHNTAIPAKTLLVEQMRMHIFCGLSLALTIISARS